MTTKEIADLFLEAVGKIEFYWNFYVVTVIGIIGWIISSKPEAVLRWTCLEKMDAESGR